MGDGLKLMEQALSGGGGTGSGLLLLLAASNGDCGRGGGDYRQEDPNGIVGRWAGDRIALIGDYAKLEDLPEEFDADLVYDLCRGSSSQEIAQDLRDYAMEDMERYGQEHDRSKEQLKQADRIEKLESFTDITEMVKAALEADGYVRYKEDEYGLMNRYLQGEAGFEDDAEGWYRVVVEPLNAGVMEGVTEFRWRCNHYNHALNKAKKRGLTPTSIIFLGKEG